MEVKPYNDYTINELINLYQKGKIIFNTEYQRSDVWNKKRKKKLIDSILRNWSIGMIFLREKNGNYEVLDGQQRLRSLFEFIGLMGNEKKFSTDPEFTPEFCEKSYGDVKRDGRKYADFISFKIPYTLVRDADDETTSDIFLRLQEGVPLNTAEKLNAMKGRMRNFILDLSRHPLLGETSLDDKRFGHRHICAQLVQLELESDLRTRRFPNIKFDKLRDMYYKYRDRSPPSWLNGRIRKTFNFLRTSLGGDTKLIKRRGDFIPLYLLTSYANDKFVTRGKEEKFKEFVGWFLSNVDNVNIRKTSFSEGEIPYKEYKEARSTGAMSSESFKKRYEIILAKFLEYIPGLRMKDEKRLFDDGQKLAIYFRDKGLCQKCKGRVKFDEAEFHHKIEWNEGGKTTVENGELVHSECH